MKIKKELPILFFIIAVLLFYINSETNDKTNYALPKLDEIAAADITMLTIKKADTEIKIWLKDDKWVVGKKEFPADKGLIDDMLKTINGLKLNALASERKNYTAYQLDDKQKIIISVFAGDRLLRTVHIGKPVSSYGQTFVMIDDDHRVYHSQGNFRDSFDQSESYVRDKAVLTLSGEIASLKLTRPDNTLTLKRASAPISIAAQDQAGSSAPAVSSVQKWITADGRNAVDDEVNRLARTIRELHCEIFIEDMAKTDFRDPIFTATITGANTHTLTIFKKDGEQYPAISSDRDHPFYLNKWDAERIMVDFQILVK
ncbi:DUF4340 domain-containing protein [bacterium]|nr:DUF4340 domain-containing protein [bacterium]